MNLAFWYTVTFSLLLAAGQAGCDTKPKPQSPPNDKAFAESKNPSLPDDKTIAAMSPEEKVKLARLLTERAIHLKNDPEGALRLLTKACDVAEMAKGAKNAGDLIIQFKANEVDLSTTTPLVTWQ